MVISSASSNSTFSARLCITENAQLNSKPSSTNQGLLFLLWNHLLFVKVVEKALNDSKGLVIAGVPNRCTLRSETRKLNWGLSIFHDNHINTMLHEVHVLSQKNSCSNSLQCWWGMPKFMEELMGGPRVPCKPMEWKFSIPPVDSPIINPNAYQDALWFLETFLSIPLSKATHIS